MSYVQLLIKKERLEQYLIGRCIHIIDLAPKPTFKYGLVCLVLGFFLVSSLTMALAPGRSPSWTTFRLVEPGHYRPRQCAQWKFEDNTSAQLEHALSVLHDTAVAHKVNVLTGNQVSIPFCVLEYQSRVVMLNPKISSHKGSSKEYTVKLNSLCGPQNTSRYSAKLSQEIGLSWTEPSTRALKIEHFDGQTAYELQVALLVMRGEDICQNEPETKKTKKALK